MKKLLKRTNLAIAFALMLCISITAFIVGFTVAKADDSGNAAADLVIDANGTDSWLEVDDRKLSSHTVDNNPALNVFNGDGTTEFMWTEGEHANKEISVKLANPVKAADYDTVEVRIAGDGNRIMTAYALSDTDCAYSAGSIRFFGRTAIKNFIINAKILANADGNIEGFKFKRTDLDETAGQFFVDYIKFVKHSEKYSVNMTKPISDFEAASTVSSYGAWLEVDGGAIAKLAATSVLGVFDKNDVMASWTEGDMVAKPITVRLATPIKAENGINIEMNIAAGSACTLEGYALGDTAFEHSAGSAEYTGNNAVTTLKLNTEKLADADGYIRGFVFRRTAGDAASGQYFVDGIRLAAADIPKIDEKPEEDVLLDMDTVSAWLEVGGNKITKCTVDNDPGLPIFGGDGSSKFTWTEDLGSNAEVTVRFGKKYKAENYLQIAMKLAVGNWVEENKVTITVYSLTDTNNSHPLASFSAAGSKTKGNIIGYVVFDAKDVADSESYIGGFRLVKTQTDDTKQGQIFADDVTLIIVPTAAPEENVIADFDGQGAWLDGRQDRITADNNPDLPFFINDGANGTTKQTWTEGETENGITSYTIKLGRKYKAEFFDYVKIRVGASNWGGENTVTVSGYGAGEDAKSAGSVKFGYGNTAKTLKLKAAPLAGEDGYISEIVIKRTHSGVNKTVQLAFDYVEFCLVGSEPEPVVAGEYIEKDISEVMPIGAGKEFNVVADKDALNTVSVAASVKATAYDKLNFTLTPNYNGKFSAYVLMKAGSEKDTHEKGGIFFWFTNSSISVGAVSEGSTNMEEIPVSELPKGSLESGKATKISVAAIPYYIDGVQEGYYCAVYLDGSETATVEIYLENTAIVAGVYTNICTQDIGNDFTVKLASTKETPVSAEEMMNVKLATTSGKTEFKTPRAGLTLSHFEVAGEKVGDLVIEGDATYDKDTKFLTFTKEGTVKVYYTVKNAFGEFKSNELSLTYVTEKPTDSGNSSGNGCFGTVSGTSVLFAIAGIATAAVIAKKKKND
mgnify:CR=1 FL=1